MFRERRAGVLLHPTSLPGPHGSGDLGADAHRFVSWLAAAGQTYWQMLPVVPPAGGRSPYQSTSAFAGDPMLIDLRALVADGLLDGATLGAPSETSDDEVRFGPVTAFREAHLRRAFDAFRAKEDALPPFFAYCAREAGWLDDYALFAALKGAHGGAAWTTWEEGLRERHDGALASARERLRVEVRYQQFTQWLFAMQWAKLREHAARLGVRLVGDIPIFVAHDSAEVWADRALFHLDARGEPTVVAGVPPDYFSATGQRWGNVLYRWDAHRATGFSWWIARFRAMLEKFDGVRVDHFIGFHRYWAIPADSPTAVSGSFEPSPGVELFEALRRAVGDAPIIAEDLGVVTPEVTALRERFGFPGMRVLQFSLSPDRGAREQLPHTITEGSVVYPGTHDNDTSRGWFAALTARAKKDPKAKLERAFVLRYLGSDGKDVAADLVRLALASPARTAIIAAQDLLSLPTEARMNVPGKTDGNWSWRLAPDALDDARAAKLRELTETFARTPLLRCCVVGVGTGVARKRRERARRRRDRAEDARDPRSARLAAAPAGVEDRDRPVSHDARAVRVEAREHRSRVRRERAVVAEARGEPDDVSAEAIFARVIDVRERPTVARRPEHRVRIADRVVVERVVGRRVRHERSAGRTRREDRRVGGSHEGDAVVRARLAEPSVRAVEEAVRSVARDVDRRSADRAALPRARGIGAEHRPFGLRERRPVGGRRAADASARLVVEPHLGADTEHERLVDGGLAHAGDRLVLPVLIADQDLHPPRRLRR